MEQVQGDRHHGHGHRLGDDHIALDDHAPLQRAPLPAHGLKAAVYHVVDLRHLHIVRAEPGYLLEQPGLELLLEPVVLDLAEPLDVLPAVEIAVSHVPQEPQEPVQHRQPHQRRKLDCGRIRALRVQVRIVQIFSP